MIAFLAGLWIGGAMGALVMSLFASEAYDDGFRDALTTIGKRGPKDPTFAEEFRQRRGA